MMRFEEACTSWQDKRLTQEEAARMLGVCERTFRRDIECYEEAGLEGLIDRRNGEVSHRKAPVDGVVRLQALYKRRYEGWNVKHFYERYQGEHGGERSYTWFKKRLQEAHLVEVGRRKGKHRKERPRKPLAGMMVHQDGSTHEWVPGKTWDLIVTMDDATSTVYSGFFVDEEGTLSSLQGVLETIEAQGLFSSFCSDRGSHYWFTPKSGGEVDKKVLTQFGRALSQLGIEMIPSYCPQGRGRSERFFWTLQGRLPQELALEGITDMAEANDWLKEHFWPRFNAAFAVPAPEAGSAFVPLMEIDLKEILCIQERRSVRSDNCVTYKGKTLQIPAHKHRCHFVKAKVRVHEYPDQSLAIFHGPRCLARYSQAGQLEGPASSGRRLRPRHARGGLRNSARGPAAGRRAHLKARPPADPQSGQFVRYKTGQFYLLPTHFI
ncbi:MAG: ISNCY family transposase [Phycisphaerales bacterium JB058]